MSTGCELVGLVPGSERFDPQTKQAQDGAQKMVDKWTPPNTWLLMGRNMVQVSHFTSWLNGNAIVGCALVTSRPGGGCLNNGLGCPLIAMLMCVCSCFFFLGLDIESMTAADEVYSNSDGLLNHVAKTNPFIKSNKIYGECGSAERPLFGT